jgi:hypothetical protein
MVIGRGVMSHWRLGYVYYLRLLGDEGEILH